MRPAIPITKIFVKTPAPINQYGYDQIIWLLFY